jgi:magnesium transporter
MSVGVETGTAGEGQHPPATGTPRTRLWRDGVVVAENFPPDELDTRTAQDGVVGWMDLCPADGDHLDAISAELGLDPLAVEDAVNRHQRPKVDRYPTHLFLTVYPTRIDPGTGALVTAEVSAFVTANVVVTVRDPHLPVAALTDRWDGGVAVTSTGALLHGLLDLVVDSHFEVVQGLDDAIEDLEEALFTESARDLSRDSFAVRKKLVRLRRVALPMREVLNTLMRRDVHVVTPELEPYYQDVYDHTLRAAEWTESLRDMVSTVFETNLSMADHRLNTVMKKLAGWAAIISLPTAVTGFFGQNVPFPGFNSDPGFVLSGALIAGGSAALYAMFRRRDWL